MTARTNTLAKLTRPKLYDAVPRPRLFALLEQDSREKPIIWISAPPGAGKTTLVASYLEAHNLRYLWYQIDRADSDPATFVHYMRTAAVQMVGKEATTLPFFNPEPQQDLGRYARAFFRELFSVLPQRSVVVLDNFHEARTTPDQRVAVAQCFEEVPLGITVIVISRADPPAEFARLIANRHIARIDSADLRCTPEESEAMLGTHQLDRKLVQRVVRHSDGWAAALVLLREHLSRPGAAVDESLIEGKEAIFQYFAGEIFNGAEPATQRVFMLTAIPPSITPQEAIALTGNVDAPRLLDYLYRRHLFTDRRRATETTFHYHALFREFLREEASRRLSPDEWRAANAHAARMLAARGQASEALTLYREAGDWEAMRTLILAQALPWARQGRAQTLSDWIAALPPAMREADPWLEYWHGRAWIFVEAQRGRPALERAYEAFRATGDLHGQALTLNTIVTGYYYEWANFVPLDRWLPEFDRLLGGDRAAKLDRESELRARAACIIALLFREPESPELDACARRLDELIDGEPDVNARMMAASTLFNYFNWKSEGHEAGALVARIEPVVAQPEVTPLMQVWWRTHLSFWHYVNGRYDRSTAVIAEAREIAQRYGLEAYLFEIDHAETSSLISKGDYVEASNRMDAIQRRLSPTRRMDWAYFHHLQGTLFQRLGNFGAAVQAAERAVTLARETGLPSLQIPHFLARLAHSQVSAGDRERGMRTLDEAIAIADGATRRNLEQQRELLRSEAEIVDGDLEVGCKRLGAVLADFRLRNQTVFLRNQPDLAARLANFALEHDTESDFVRTLIERNALQAPLGAGPAWPFRLRVRALGGFELIRDGQPMRFSGKAQQRPLDLLKLLVAQGGTDVDTQQMMTALWPDADGAAAKTSFDTTLFRLRKLLDVENALPLAGGKLSLSHACCWTDVRVLEAMLNAANDACDAQAPSSGASLTAVARRLLDAYHGSLLGTEEHPWLVKPRDALRARFVRALLRLGERLERTGDWAAAIDLYRRGLEADNLAEPFYRGLMRSLVATGDRAEALNAFRRCRELLSVVLGMKPSPETERLHQEIVSGSAARGTPASQK